MNIFSFLSLVSIFFLLGCSGEPEGGRNVEWSIQDRPSLWTNEKVHQVIRDKNSHYNGKALFKLEKEKLTALDLTKTNVTDFSFLQSMQQLKILDLRGLSIRDLTPLKGVSLQILGIEDTPIEDLTPLRGMHLERLYVNNTRVRDISPLSGMPLKLLNLYGTAIEDLSPLQEMRQLQFLWLNKTPVSDISSLSNCPLTSLTLHKTRVKDLSPLRRIKTLERLHIAETPVTDLAPIKDLKLKRLIYSPDLTRGNEVVKQMVSLREVGTELENRMSPEIFWSLHE
jgi:Leucine-rich repeat (LRR) protein